MEAAAGAENTAELRGYAPVGKIAPCVAVMVQAAVVWAVGAIEDSAVLSAVIAGIFSLVNTVLLFVLPVFYELRHHHHQDEEVRREAGLHAGAGDLDAAPPERK